MRIRKHKPQKPQLPTAEQFLTFTPRRLDFQWKINNEGRVEIIVPKFTSNVGVTFCKLLRKENKFTAHLDEIGSLVWQQCDGNHTVKQILEALQKKFPNQKEIDQRLFLFFQQMRSLNYLEY